MSNTVVVSLDVTSAFVFMDIRRYEFVYVWCFGGVPLIRKVDDALNLLFVEKFRMYCVMVSVRGVYIFVRVHAGSRVTVRSVFVTSRTDSASLVWCLR